VWIVLSQALINYQDSIIKAFKDEPDSTGFIYHKWFKENAVLFEQVDRKQSELLSLKHDCQIKQCYLNVWRAVIEDHSLQYYEGFVISNSCPVPLEHAWAVKNGKVIDPTLIIRIKEVSDRIGSEYYGIHLPTDYVTKRALKTKRSGAYILDYFGEKHGITVG